MRIKTEWEFGDTVYLRNDPEQNEYFITGVLQRPGSLILKISFCGEEKEIYEFEVTKEFNFNKKMGIPEKEPD